MKTSGARVAVLLVVVAASAAMYLHDLASAPPHIQIDEAMIAINAHAIATTGKSVRGDFLPLYTQTAEHSWYQPMVIYVSAAALKVLPLDEWSVRLPTVLFCLIDITLMFLLVQELYGSAALAAVAGLLLALTPAHFIHGRYGMDYLYPIAFILGWLLCLVWHLKSGRPWQLALAVGILGVGFYCYISSIVMMPVYFAFTLLALYDRKSARGSYFLAAGVFLPLLVPFTIWLAGHPSAFTATVDKYGLYDTAHLNAAQGLRSAFSFLSVSQRLSQYWNYFDPSLLFFGSGIKVQFSTNLVGVFLLPVAAFMVAGIYDAATRRHESINRLILLGFFTAPLAACIATEENAIFRALGLLPFGVLLATIGVRFLWRQPLAVILSLGMKVAGIVMAIAGAVYATWSLVTAGHLTSSSVPLIVAGIAATVVGRLPDRVMQLRAVTLGLLVLCVLQFGSFWTDYFSAYRVRSAFWLGGNVRGALEEIIDHAKPGEGPAVYFSPLTSSSGQADWRNDFLDTYWRFYLTKHHREDLLARTLRFDPTQAEAMAPGSLVLGNTETPAVVALVKQQVLTPVITIPELDGRDFFVIYRR